MPPGRPSEVRVETILCWILAQMPLPGHTRPIPLRLQGLSERHKLFIKDFGILDGDQLAILRLTPVRIPYRENSVPWRIVSRHQTSP